MKKIILFFMLFTIFIYSQEYGHRIFLDNNNTQGIQAICDMTFSEIPNDFSDTQPYVFNVFFHKITDENGNTPDIYNSGGYSTPDGIGDGDLIVEETYLEAIRALNINYNKFNIFFKYRGNDLIKNSQYLNLNSLNDYENLINFSKTYVNDKGEISYKNNALNYYITHSYNSDPLYTWSFPRYLKSEFLYFYNVFQPMGIGPIASPTPQPYDKINAIVSFDLGKQLGLLRTARHSTNPLSPGGVVNFYWSENVTRDETSPYYNANYTGDRVSDSRANTWAVENDPLDTNTNLRRYRIYGDVCSCNNKNIIADGIKDYSTFIDNGDGTYTPTGDYYIDAPVFNIMSRFMYDRFDTSACNKTRSLTNGQGARLRCLINYRIDLWRQFLADDGVASLYEPYKGNYNLGSELHIKPTFQPGFDYEFVECENWHPIPTDYGDHSFIYGNIYYSDYSYSYDKYSYAKITHESPTAIRILQIDDQPEKCFNIFKTASSGIITKFEDNIINTNVTIIAKDSLQINNQNLIQDLPKGLYKIEKQFNDGSNEQNLIFKQD